jgi:hypothetical protein
MSAHCTGASLQASSLTRKWKAMPASSRSALMVVREDIVSVDDAARRVVWAIVGQQFHHYNAAAQVFDDDGGARFVWTTDLLRDELAGNVEAMMDAGIGAIKKTIESG